MNKKILRKGNNCIFPVIGSLAHILQTNKTGDPPEMTPSCDLLTFAAITSSGDGRIFTEGGVGRALLSPFCFCVSHRLSLADNPLCKKK